jgi:DNA polymerase III subunit epsilon
LDTETTSLDGEVIDLAILGPEGEILFDSLIKPMERVIEEARRIHHISDEMLASAPSFADVWLQIAEIFSMGRRIITYNAEFDYGVLINSAIMAGVEYALLKGTWECLMEKYRMHAGKSRWQKLDDALRQQKLPVSNTHRALADAQAAYSLLVHLARNHEKVQPLAPHLSDSSLIEGKQFKRIIGASESAQDEMLHYTSAKTEPLAESVSEAPTPHKPFKHVVLQREEALAELGINGGTKTEPLETK